MLKSRKEEKSIFVVRGNAWISSKMVDQQYELCLMCSSLVPLNVIVDPWVAPIFPARFRATSSLSFSKEALIFNFTDSLLLALPFQSFLCFTRTTIANSTNVRKTKHSDIKRQAPSEVRVSSEGLSVYMSRYWKYHLNIYMI